MALLLNVSFRQEPKAKITALAEKQMSKPESWLSNGKWVLSEMDKYSVFISRWKVERLWIYENQRRTILKEISEIQFSALTTLSLSNNQIQSVHLLSRISVPLLESLYLSSNNLSNIKEFGKLNWNNCHTISLNLNQIQDGRSLVRFNGKCLKMIRIENDKQNSQIQDVSWTVKLNSSDLDWLIVDSPHRIRRRILEGSIKRYFVGMKISSKR